ncbi:hypothetical protein BDV93DRAFT_603770 [Ceratobasidium sp. AG-I]|nr:hypothetical protein BDV93DRAFT_603770 [Ceratobasidium sp. AG-I]
MESLQEYLPLADFFYHIVGDKSTYSQELQDLYVCYTLTRGLQVESTSPRRPALPLELILSITRFAGYISVNPDPALALEMSLIHCADPHLFCGGYTTPPLSRAHLSSMARIRLVYNPPLLPSFPEYEHNSHWDQIEGDGVLILRPCIESAPRLSYYSLPRVRNLFTSDHEVLRRLEGDNPPGVRVIASRPARLLVWKWWEPKF